MTIYKRLKLFKHARQFQAVSHFRHLKIDTLKRCIISFGLLHNTTSSANIISQGAVLLIFSVQWG